MGESKAPLEAEARRRASAESVARRADAGTAVGQAAPSPRAAAQRRLADLANRGAQARATAGYQALLNGGPGAARRKAQAPSSAGSAELQGLDDEITGDARKTRIQLKVVGGTAPVQREAAPPPRANHTGLPDALKTGVESLSGVSLDHVRVHYGSAKPAALQAHAFTQGPDIHVAPGQERHLPHEAWHAAQQAQGRVPVTAQLKEVGLNDDAGLEREADVMGARAAHGADGDEGALRASGPMTAHGAPRQLLAEPAVQRMLKVGADEYTDPMAIAAAAPQVLHPDVLARLKAMGAESTPHIFRNWSEAAARARELGPVQERGPEQAQVSDEKLEPHEEHDESVSSHAEPAQDERIMLSKLGSMAELLVALNVDLRTYMVPRGLKGYQKVANDVERFNALLESLTKEKPFAGPFRVTVNVGNLKGYGDVIAGAKLARELRLFFDTIEEWRDVNVRLYLDKVSKDGDQDALEKAKSALGGANVTIENPDEDEPQSDAKQEIPAVSLAYPATNMEGDFKVAQYGHDPLARSTMTDTDEPPLASYSLGSGPGHGALGTLPVSQESQQKAVQGSLEPGDVGVMGQIAKLKEQYGLEAIHFGYFSIYKNRPREFAKEVVSKSPAQKIGVAISKSVDPEAGIADALATMGHTVTTVSISKDGKAAAGKTYEPKKAAPTKGKKSSSQVSSDDAKSESGSAPKQVYLLSFPEGVRHEDMLSLYYTSDAPVGATGDQSLVEAYTMRSLKKAHQGDQEDHKRPDILYDVADQQRGLFQQLSDMESKSITKDPKSVSGLQPIHVSPHVQSTLDTKRLLFPIVMLINKALHEKAAVLETTP